MSPEPTPARMIVCGLIVAAVAVAIWWVVEIRSAPPPPPLVTMPGSGK
ncbi:MAG: hypothetical protein WCF18_06635 [Chthoniobacteraceae bacterium]